MALSQYDLEPVRKLLLVLPVLDRRTGRGTA